MAKALELAKGGYSYIPGPSQYSGGVVAGPGFRIERVTFTRPLPLRAGFERMAEILRAAGRPLTALCACELRSPAPFTEEGFKTFNRGYVEILASWGLIDGGANPVARSNLCPGHEPPSEPSVHAFSFTQAAAEPDGSFVVSGSGEAQEGRGSYRESIVRFGDTSPSGMEEKARWVLGAMERRMAALGADWTRATAVHVYTVHDIGPFFERELVRRGAARHGLTWFFVRPPVIDLEYEMDCRRVLAERVVAV